MSEVDSLLASLVGDDEWSRHQMLDRLRGEGASSDQIRALVAALRADHSGRRAGARMALAALAAPRSPAAADTGAALVEGLRSPDADLRVLSASAMGESGNDAFGPSLIEALADRDPNVVAAAADALGALGDPGAIGPLTELTTHPVFWVRAAAVVALGQLQDARAIPALESAGRTAGLEATVVEALRRIGDPSALPALERLGEAAPGEALDAAGAILASHPALEAPAWVVQGGRERVDGLLDRLRTDDDPVSARLLGLTGTRRAIDELLALAATPRRSEAALIGLLAVPAALRTEPILDRLADAEPEDQVTFLGILPPLEDSAAIHRLIPLLSRPQSAVRTASAEALARSSVTHSSPVLVDELTRPDVAPEVIRASGALGSSACVALLPLLEDAEPAVRAAAADALGRCADAAVGEHLIEGLDRETDARARRSLLSALARVSGGGAVPTLRGALDDPDPETRVTVIEALGATGSARAIPDLETRLTGPGHERLAAIRALGEIGDADAIRLIEPFLGDPDRDTRRTTARAALPAARSVSLTALEALAADPDGWLRGWAARMLGAHGNPAVPVLDRLAAEDPDPAVRAEARRALERKA